MRTIKFRVKGRNNQWHYGYPLVYNDESFSFVDYEKLNDDRTPLELCTLEYVEDDTLGQFTGLCDKGGKKIYEGDIVEFETNVNCITSELKPYWKDCYEKQYALGGGSWWVRKDQAIVQWNSKDGMWDLKVYNNGRYKRKSKLFTFRDSDYFVVGNIYDNPELLGGGDEDCDN